MVKLIVTSGFRLENRHYPAGKKPVDLPAAVAKFALENKLAVDPDSTLVTDVDEARRLADLEEQERVKARSEKSKGDAPENK